MGKTKWFLIGAIFAMFFGDWLHLRVEVLSLREVSSQALESAESRGDTTEKCLSTLSDVKTMLQGVRLRSEIAVLTRVQALDLYSRARKGDPKAKEMLRDLGLDPNTVNEFPSSAAYVQASLSQNHNHP